jgi:multidrug efflux pump subunit AcrA (membrane-fusion protein)
MTTSRPTEPETSFQERALGDTPSPLEHIDHLFQHTSRRIWLGILGLVILLAAAVLWTAVATEEVIATAPAVLVPRAGLFVAGSSQGGVVTSVRVAPGAVVRRGQVLATVAHGGAGATAGVLSPIDGRVVEVNVRSGDPSPPGAQLFLIAPRTPPLIVGLYPAAQVSQLAVGQPAEVAVNGVATDRYGSAVGKIVAISPIPVTSQRLTQLTGDSSLVGVISRLGPAREIDIALTPAPTPSGVKWTDGNGPPSRLPIGVRAVATVTVGRQTLLHKAFG